MTKKDAYYVPHDSNAKRDPKLMLLRHQLGAQGYGVYWMLIEDLREQEDYSLPVMIIPALAHEYNISEQILKTIIENFGLFNVQDDKFFFSPSLISRMENWNVKKAISRERAKKAADARWQKALGEKKQDAEFNETVSTSKSFNKLLAIFG
jgi:hypothetical protein